MKLEQAIVLSLEAANELEAALDAELEQDRENYRKAGRNPESATPALKSFVLDMAQIMLNTTKPTPEQRALIDGVIIKWYHKNLAKPVMLPDLRSLGKGL